MLKPKLLNLPKFTKPSIGRIKWYNDYNHTTKHNQTVDPYSWTVEPCLPGLAAVPDTDKSGVLGLAAASAWKR